MTCLAGDKWEVTPYHVWSGLAWALAFGLTVAGVALESQRLAWTGMFLTGAAMTYNICANHRAVMQTQREAFDLGVEHERRRTAATGLPRVGR